MNQVLPRFRSLLILVAWCLLPLCTMAQGWQRFVGGLGDQRAFSVRLTTDGGIVASGSSNDTLGAQTDWFYFTADSTGLITSQYAWGASDSSEYAVSIMSIDSQVLLLGNVEYNFSDSNGITQRSGIIWNTIDPQGNISGGGKDFQDFSSAAEAIPFENGHLVLGTRYVSSTDFYYPEPYAFYLDSNNTIAWIKTFPGALTGEALDAVIDDDHGAYVLCKEYTAGNSPDLLLYKITASGDVLTEKHLMLPEQEQPDKILKTVTGSLYVVGNQGESGADRDIFLTKIDPLSLDTLWFRRVHLPGTQTPHGAVLLPNGDIAVAGEYIPQGAASRDAFLALLNEQGDLLWFKTYGGLKGDIFWDIQNSSDGNGFVIAGQTASYNSGGDLQAWLVKTDSLGRVWSNRVIGHVFRDELQNCVADAGETPLSNWLVSANGPSGNLYTLTDSIGNYDMELDSSTWFISTLPPAGYWAPCEDSIEVTFGQSGDTILVDFPTQVLYACPLLDVDITTPLLRRCFENNYYVRYYNYGTSTAPDAIISVVLDPYLSVTGSDFPFTQAGDTLFFAVGEVPWLSGGSFQFTALLSCDSTILGQMHCTEAHIYPDSLCYNFNPDWDGSHLEIDGYCAGDSVVLRVTNTGGGMQGPVSYIITEDQIIFKLSALQLGANQDTTFVLYPNGSTVTIVVTQAPGHPGNSQPMLVVEGCGGGLFSTGYAFQFPQNDGDPSTDIECRANIGAFDPNDKTGLPLGVGAEGVIETSTKIEYLIRFQNTGTDTAFRVEIIDTLASTLDLATFREGAGSHPYRLIINGEGVLHFVFDPIALPDSIVNWAASQGFVKFSICPKPDLDPGTKIENEAAIYFDFNPAVVTNSTLHTINNPRIFLSTKTNIPQAPKRTDESLLIIPNPCQGQILVNLLRPSYSGGLQVEISDLLGRSALRCRKWLNPNEKALEIDISSLPAGLYYLIAKDERGSIIARERLVKI